MAYYSAAILAIAASFLASASALELTTSNFDEITTGKTVFIKFYAPWCGHCKAMAADWARLENDFADHNIALVASVDCSEEENDSICEDFGVEGFPTIAWGDSHSASHYTGGRDYASMKKFADEKIVYPVCSILTVGACSDEEKADIAFVEEKTDAELLEVVTKFKEVVKEEEKEFEKWVEDLQRSYEAKMEEHSSRQGVLRAEGKIKFIEQVFKKRGIENPLKSNDPMMDEIDDDDDLGGGEL